MSADAHDDRRQRLLDAVLAGELDPAAAEVVELGRTDPDFAAELAQLRRVQQRLAARADDVRSDVQEPAPDLEAAAERAFRARARPTVARRQTVFAWLAAAVLVAAAFAWWQPWAAPTAPQWLGRFPVTATADGTGLQFQHELAAGEYFVVTVTDETGHTRFESGRLQTSTWRPGPELSAQWNARWQVTVVAEASDGERRLGRSLPGWVPRR